jgi:ATP-dependent DNA helicase DinG
MLEHFTDTSLDLMRYAITEAHGREVFFLGQTDAERRVVQLEVLARGSDTAVPAILQTCNYGDVVIHNHPSGNLQPSTADISIASQLGNLGVGFFIVNNAVDKLYRVVEPFAEKDVTELAHEDIDRLLGPTGVIAGKLADYEERPEQLRMAFAIGDAFNQRPTGDYRGRHRHRQEPGLSGPGPAVGLRQSRTGGRFRPAPSTCRNS